MDERQCRIASFLNKRSTDIKNVPGRGKIYVQIAR